MSQSYISPERNLTGLLHLIGYFEEAEHSRFCLLYALLTHFGPIDIESPRMPSIVILSDLLYSNTYEPTLEVKYRLAHNVATAVFDLHSKGVVHGNVMAGPGLEEDVVVEFVQLGSRHSTTVSMLT